MSAALLVTHAAITEHEIYLRSACSFLCSEQVGGVVIRDGVFLNPMRRYEELYAEYFKLFCDSIVGDELTASSSHALLPYLRYQLAEQRTGDTVKMRVDALRAKLGRSSSNSGEP